MNGLQTLKCIFTKRKFLKFGTSKNRLRKVSKLPYTKNIMLLCFNTVQSISIEKIISTFENFIFYKIAFQPLRKHSYNPRAHFFKRLRKISKLPHTKKNHVSIHQYNLKHFDKKKISTFENFIFYKIAFYPLRKHFGIVL